MDEMRFNEIYLKCRKFLLVCAVMNTIFTFLGESIAALEELKNSHSILFENGDLENQINTDRLSFEDQKEDEPFMDENKFDFMINSDRDHNTKDEYKEA